MEHLTLKAVVNPTEQTTDQGLFEAVISTETVDREKDVVSAAAMVAALSKWNRPIPLAWNHSGEAKDIFGTIDPASVKEVAGEVVASGQVHLDSEVGRDAWRLMKSRTLGFSFGYLVTESKERDGGGRHITGLDVFEVTGTPTPMNNDTRVLSTKAIPEIRAELAAMQTRLDEFKAQLDAAEPKDKPSEDVEPPPADEDEDVRDEEPEGPTPEASDPEADRIELERLEALT